MAQVGKAVADAALSHTPRSPKIRKCSP